METKLIHRTIHPAVRIHDAEKGLVDYVASDETVDCYRELIRASGWKFDQFKKNAPFLDSHQTHGVGNLLGEVVRWRINRATKALEERVRYAIDVPENTLARFAFNMVAKGYLRAVSVGFYPEKTIFRGEDGWGDQMKEAGVKPKDADGLRCVYVRQQQVELSQCVIGANPNALAKAFRDGAATEEEMAALGFGGQNDFEFLQLASDTWEHADAAQRSAVVRELQTIYARRQGVAAHENARGRAAGSLPGAARTSPEGADDEGAGTAETRRELGLQLERAARRALKPDDGRRKLGAALEKAAANPNH